MELGRVGALVLIAVLTAFGSPMIAAAGSDGLSVTVTAPKVKIRAKGEDKFVKVSDTKPASIGDVVRTGVNGLAQIDYPDGSYTRLDHGTKFVVEKLVD